MAEAKAEEQQQEASIQKSLLDLQSTMENGLSSSIDTVVEKPKESFEKRDFTTTQYDDDEEDADEKEVRLEKLAKEKKQKEAEEEE